MPKIMDQPTPRPIFLTLAGLINQEMSARVFNIFANAIRDGYEDFHLLIQSSGGYIGDGVGIHNYLSKLPIRLTTYNVGQVSSIAVLVFLAGFKRVAAETATFMIHRPLNTAIGGPANIVEAAVTSLRIDEERCENILKSKLDLPAEQWATYAHNDLTFSATQALAYGAISEFSLFSPLHGAPLFNV